MTVRWYFLFLFLLPALRAGENWDSPHVANPIVPGYNADPSLVQLEGKFYLYATNDPWGGDTLGCWVSKDFKQWTYHELNWPTKEACTSPTSKNAMVWAPSVIKANNGQYYMYVSVGSEIWVGTSDHPLGPWKDAHDGKPLIAATFDEKHHMIDAEAFIDDNGEAYLYWGSGWNWKDGRCYAVKLKPDMVNFDGEPRDVTPANYFEAPFMVKQGSHYLLTYSSGVTIRDTYEVRYAVGATPFGPFKEAANSPILSTDRTRNVVSLGHHAIFNRGGQNYILYHRQSAPYVEGSAFRQLCIDELSISADGQIDKVTPTHTGPVMIQHRIADEVLYAQATASSELDAQHGAFNVLDDNYATRWAAAPGAKGGWLQLDLGSLQSIYRQELRFEYAWKNYRFVLETSIDGEKWTPLADRRTRGLGGSPLFIDAPVRARFLRLTFPPDVPSETLSLWEWVVYGN